MTAKPLTATQAAVLSEIFRDRMANPRTIARKTGLSVAAVLSALRTLRQKHYVFHSYRGASNPGKKYASWWALKTLSGEKLRDLNNGDLSGDIAEYLKTHKITKVPAGRATDVCSLEDTF